MKKMKLRRLSLLLLPVLPLRTIMGAEDLPKPYNFARYQGMTDRSPFAVATTVAPAEAPNFAKDLYVANAAHNGKEGDLVTIASSTDRNWKRYLSTGAPVDGFNISNIEWSEKVGATKVTITKDGQSATLIFNEALLKQPVGAQNAAAPPAPQKPPDGNPATQSAAALAPAGQQGATKAMPVPQLPTPPPRVRGVIPRNPAAAGGKPSQ